MGSLCLDKPVQEYLPKPLSEYENDRALAEDARFKKIAARMLLSHTSGLPNWRWFTDDQKLRIYFEPGYRFAYSGEGIDLLQLVVESIEKKGLQELMEEQVFGRLGMSRSSMVWEPRFEGDFANGYDEQEKSLGPQRRKLRGRLEL
jgi:CubicO group peptidase (beta-lactamase class C family)